MPDFANLTWGMLLIAHAVLTGIVVLAVVWRRRWLRPIAVVAGAVALWLPLFALLDTLGLPNPYPPEGDYKVIATRYDEDRQIMYLFADTLGRDFTPRVFGMAYDRQKYSRLEQNPDYSVVVMRLSNSGGGDYEVVYVDYEPPDLLKDGMVRGWQAPRETD